MGELQPLRDDLPESARALAEELRTLFRGLGISLNRYACRIHRDPGSVSRYFSGERVPGWGFVHDLLAESTRHSRQVPPTRAVVEHLRRMHRAALQAGGSPTHRIQLLQDRLADADREAELALARERELEEALRAAQYRIAHLTVRERELQVADVEQREAYDAALEVHQQQIDDLCEIQAQLLAQIEQLHEQLRTAQRRRIDAERRCAELEQQLETARSEDAPDAGPQLEALRADYEQRVTDERRRAEALQRRLDRLQAPPPADRESVNRLEQVSPDVVAVLTTVQPDAAAVVLTGMTPVQAAAALNAMHTATAATVLAEMRPLDSAAALKAMATANATALLTAMDADSAGAALSVLDTDTATALLTATNADSAGSLLAAMRTTAAAAVLTAVGPQTTIAMLNAMHARAAKALAAMNIATATAQLTAMDADSAAAALSAMETDTATALLAALGPPTGIAILNAMYTERAAAMLRAMDQDTATAVLRAKVGQAALRLYGRIEDCELAAIRIEPIQPRTPAPTAP